MSKTTKILIAVMAVVLLVATVVTLAAHIDGRDRNRDDRTPAEASASGDGASHSTFPFAVWIPIWSMWVAIYAASQAETWPVTQAFSASRNNRPERREQQVRQYTSLRFSTSERFAQFARWIPAKGERTSVLKDGETKIVVATFKDGSEYRFTVVKRQKGDPKGFSGYVIDDVRGGEFDSAD